MFIRLIISLLLFAIAGSAGARHPLQPMDTSSPRATIASFISATDEVARRYNDYRESPGPATQKALSLSTARGWRLLDLSEVTPAARHEVAAESFVLLWEVIARLQMPKLEEIPTAIVEGALEQDAEQLLLWRIPGTEISIIKVEKGARAGEFLFSADTVGRVREFYEMSRELPYLRPMPIDNLSRIQQRITGWMIPLAWVEALPDRANMLIYEQVLWKWILLLLLFGLALAIVVVSLYYARRKSWNGSFGLYLRYSSTPLVMLLLAPLVGFLTRHQINVTGTAARVPDYVLQLVVGLALIWLVWLSVSWAAEFIILNRINKDSLKAHLIRLSARLTGILVIIAVVFHTGNQLGIPVYGLVAGAGVSGIAIALAAKSTLENFIGTLNLYADRPVSIGDLCRYDEDSSPGWRPVGRVESIGLRSTKIRRLDRTLITIPNAEFAQRHIVNLSACDRFLLTTTLNLRYETTDDQLRFVLVKLREILHAHPKAIHTAADPVRARFTGFGEHALNVSVRAYIRASDYNEFLAIQEDILLRAMKVVLNAGTSIAYPSQTLYLAKDSGLNKELQVHAEQQVKAWAGAHNLPFPDHAESDRRQITDSLDYPPEGSPGADSG